MSKCGQGIKNYIKKPTNCDFSQVCWFYVMCLTLYVFMLLGKWEFAYPLNITF